MNNVDISVDDEGIACLTLNRPLQLNALSIPLMEDVIGALHGMAARDDICVLIVTGRGRGFCAGADLSLFADENPAEISLGNLVSNLMRDYFNPLVNAFYRCPRPVIMAVNGIAAGGGVGVALCGDIVLAARSSAFKVVQVPQLEIAADLGANWILPRVTGRSRALGIVLLGDTIPAQKLENWGLVWECVDDSQLLSRAEEIARQLAAVPSDTVLATRQLVDASTQQTFEQLLQQERHYQRDLCDRSGFASKVARFLAEGSSKECAPG